MEKSKKNGTQFLLRMTGGEAVQLEAIARKLGVTKSEVLRLSLSSQASLKSQKTDTDSAVISEALGAVSARVKAIDDRLQNLESLLSSAVDLLLSVSRNTQPAQRQTEPQQKHENAHDTQKPASPSWADYSKKHYKSSPIMSDEEWSDFLKKHYTDKFGHPPDLTT